MPAAIGGKLARPQTPVLAFSGDGGAQFTINELSVLAETKASLLYVVWNDDGYGEIRRCQDKAFSTDVQRLDFKKLAEVYGLKALSVGSAAEFDTALASQMVQDALLRDGPPVVLEVRVCEAITKPVPSHEPGQAEAAPIAEKQSGSTAVVGARSTVSSVPPYKYGKSIEEVSRVLGLKDVVKLNSNENNYAPLGPVADVLRGMDWGKVGLYPDHDLFTLKDRLAEVCGCTPDRIGVHAGAWSVLRLVATAFLEPGTRALTSSISYALYQSLTEIAGADIDVFENDEGTLALNLDRMAAAITPETRIVWLCNPNNPTGTGFGSAELERLLDVLDARTDGRGWVVLDEAYYGFATPGTLADGVRLSESRNVISIRSMSKVYGLAGLRIGYVIGPTNAVSLLDHLSDPFTNSRPALAAARASLTPEGMAAAEHSVGLIMADRVRIETELNRMAGASCPCPPSFSNFVMVETPGIPAGKLAQALLEQSGLIVRPCDAWWGLTYHTRVTVGTTQQTDRFLEAMQKILANKELVGDVTSDHVGELY
jgi:histidinol-phosphate aminotransferase